MADQVEYTATQGGFIMHVNLSRYWSIPLLLGLGLLTSGTAYELLARSQNYRIEFRILGLAVFLIVFSVAWWDAFMYAFGSLHLVLEATYLTIEVGIGPFKLKRQLDIRSVASISDSSKSLRAKIGPPKPLIVLVLKDHVHGAFREHRDFGFGRYLSRPQMKFIRRKLEEVVQSAA